MLWSALAEERNWDILEKNFYLYQAVNCSNTVQLTTSNTVGYCVLEIPVGSSLRGTYLQPDKPGSVQNFALALYQQAFQSINIGVAVSP